MRREIHRHSQGLGQARLCRTQEGVMDFLLKVKGICGKGFMKGWNLTGLAFRFLVLGFVFFLKNITMIIMWRRL